MGSRKTTGKTTAPQKVPQEHGGALNSGGTPGNAGGGRLPDEYKDWLNTLKRDPAARRVFETYLKSGNIRFWDHAAKYSESPPAQQVNVAHRVEFVRARETKRK